MSVYLEKLVLPDRETEERIFWQRYIENGYYLDNDYPCGFFTYRKMIDGELICRGLTELDFEGITILYGGNGSGKTTLLNIIASKLGLKRLTPFNNSELFSAYVDECDYRMADEDSEEMTIPAGSMMVTSDDVFDYMLVARANNDTISQNIDVEREEYARLMNAGNTGTKIQLKGLENFEEFKKQNLAWRKTRRKFVHEYAGREVKLGSNGETALDFFSHVINNDALYCMDEPENSLSPKMQLKLKEVLESKSRYCGCQLIIATHSPFILALEHAKIYNLDATPITLSKWWEVENAKTYFDFFYKNKELFLKGK